MRRSSAGCASDSAMRRQGGGPDIEGAALSNSAALVSRWRELAAQLRRYGADAQACTLENAATELEAAELARDEEPLSIEEAAKASGYSEEHLRRQIRDGVIPNAGRRGKPLVLRRHLPRKPATVIASGTSVAYDPIADARSLSSRRKGGANGGSQSTA
jgi:hypothetical protein